MRNSLDVVAAQPGRLHKRSEALAVSSSVAMQNCCLLSQSMLLPCYYHVVNGQIW